MQLRNRDQKSLQYKIGKNILETQFLKADDITAHHFIRPRLREQQQESS